MRSLRNFFVLALMALIVVIPNFAQDTSDSTIADVVLAASESDTPEFTYLYAALTAANPVYLEAFSNTDYTFTVFAPTDAAFEEMMSSLGMTSEEVLANVGLLDATLAYHIIPGILTTDKLSESDGALLGTLLNGMNLTVSATDEAVLVNYGTLVGEDIISANGIIHALDSVLIPDMSMLAPAPEETPLDGAIADLVASAAASEENPEFTILSAALEAADPRLAWMLSAGGGGAFTVFAPTDEAFTAYLDEQGITLDDLLADPATLNPLLAHHLLPGTFTAETLTAAAGDEGFTVIAATGVLSVTASEDDGIVIDETATVTTGNILVTNGVIHIIDAVLAPETEE